MHYLDSSAIAKLIIVEKESAALKKFLSGQLVTSSLAKIEIYKACNQYDKTLLPQVEEVFKFFLFLNIDDKVIKVSQKLVELSYLRSLDSIHLATATIVIGMIDQVVTYDKQMIKAAKELDLPVITPV